MAIENLSYEESLECLKESLEKLKSDELKLEESIEVFKEANQYYEHCNSLLDQAQGEVKLILGKEDEKIEIDFNVEG